MVADNKKQKKYTYSSAGVDIDAGNKAVDLMRAEVKSTWGPEVLTDLGSFGGLFAFDAARYKSPVLVAGTDGVGTKLKVAFLADKHDSIGIDCVAMCVNDILVQGAHPLFFLDYIAVGKMEPERIAELVKGVSAGCREAGCALIGGETAEMPGMYSPEEYDIAGFAVGVVERERVIDGSAVAPGNQIIGLPSSGLHSNGYSLVRRIVFEGEGLGIDAYIPELGMTLAEELLKPTRIYSSTVRILLETGSVSGMAHITGGGLSENIARVLPEGCRAVIRSNAWTHPAVFSWLQELGCVDNSEMYRTFNNGIGLIVIVREDQLDKTMALLNRKGERPFHIGEIISGERRVQIV